MLSITAREVASALKSEFNDTGIGIVQEAHDLIFEKFQQTDPSSTRNDGGIGRGPIL